MNKDSADAALEILNSENVSIAIFFIQRKARQQEKKKSFSYAVTKMDAAKEINAFFLKAAKAHLSELTNSKKPIDYQDYAVITDDLPEVCLTYSDADSLAVSEKTWKKIESNTDIRRVAKLAEIKVGLWYYCVSFLNTHKIDCPRLIFFKKTSSGTVATDNPGGMIKKIKAGISASDPKLIQINDEHITFDEKFDCFLFGTEFLIKDKTRFEKIADIEEEFVEHSKAAIKTFEKMDIIDGLDFLELEITGKPSMMRVLANIVKNENHSVISETQIAKMRKTLLDHEDRELNMTADGKKILIQDKEDVKDLLNLLNDYYKQGMTSGKTYGSNAGRIIRKKKP